VIIVVFTKRDYYCFYKPSFATNQNGDIQGYLKISCIDWVVCNALHARWKPTGQRASHLWQAAVSLVVSTHFWSFPTRSFW